MIRVILIWTLLVVLPALAPAEAPATWDDFLTHSPRDPMEADQMSLRLNQLYLQEAQRLSRPGLAWWLTETRQHCQENIQRAQRGLSGSRSPSPAWERAAQGFVRSYAQEQCRLARLYPKYTSEIHLERNETAGWDLPDRTFMLTFDDGPRPATTPQVLRVLRAARLPATFFVLGKRIQECAQAGDLPDYSGFRLASHGFDHANLPTLNAQQLQAQLEQTAAQAKAAQLTLSDLLRAPYGARTARELRLTDKLGLKSMLWNVDSQDWQASMQSRPQRIAGRTLALMLLHRRGIVLMHDIQPHTPGELESMLPVLRRMDYQIVPGPIRSAQGPKSGGDPGLP